MSATIVVTGGAGFIGSALVRRFVRDGFSVRVLDDVSRGSENRIADVADSIDFRKGDVRDAQIVADVVRGAEWVCHLAYVNGTARFYREPDLVLDVAVRGMLNVLDACRRHDVGRLLLASSSEVYQSAPRVPTDESAPLSVPDPLNPRYSYGGGKIISELLALNFGRKGFERVIAFRPHNIYGPDMGWDHVIPQVTVRLLRAIATPSGSGPVELRIQGSGEETRAFCYIDDLVDGVRLLLDRGEHLGIYNIGTTEEIAIRTLAESIAGCFGREIVILPGELRAGSTRRRCPNIDRISALGYAPRVALRTGLPPTVRWYTDHIAEAPTALA